MQNDRSVFRFLVAALLLCAAPAGAAPGLVEERLMCPLVEVGGPPEQPTRIRVERGRLHGLQPGGRGEIYGPTKGGGVAVVGRAEVETLDERSAWLKVLPEAGSRPGEIRAGGQVELRVLLPKGLYRGQLLPLAMNNILFLDNQRQPFATLEELLAAKDDTVEKRVLAAMVQAGHEVVDFTDTLTHVVTHGRYQGQRCKAILLASTPDDYRAFLRFVSDYPGKYLGKRWKISETYATWIINDMPPSVGDEVEELAALAGTAGLAPRVKALKEDNVESVLVRIRRQVSDWPKSRAADGEKRLALVEAIVAARPPPLPPLLLAEVEQTRARLLAKDSKKHLAAAEAYGRAAAHYAKVPVAQMREAALERIVCLNNRASFFDDAGQPDAALQEIPEVRRLVAAAIQGAPDAEIAAHARLSEAFAIALGARIANQRGDYRAVIAETTPLLDRYAAVGAPGFRDKEIELIQFIAKAHQKLGEVDAAARLLERAASRAGELGDRKRQAEIAWSIGDLRYDVSRYEESVADFQRAAALAREAGDEARHAKSLAAAAQALWALGRSQEAIARHGEALTIREATGDESGIAWQLLQVAKIRVELGERAAARQDLERALALDRKLGARRDEAEVQRELGNLALALSQPEAAAQAFAAARTLFGALKMAPDEAWATLGEGRAKSVQHDFTGAVERATAAAAIGDRTGDRELKTRSRLARGRWLRETGQRAPAQAALGEALAAAGDDTGLRIDVLVARTAQRRDDGDLAGSRADAQVALRLSEGTKDAGRRLDALFAQAGIHQVEGEYDRAVKAFAEIAELARRAGNRPQLQSALQQEAWQLANLGRLREAKRVADEASTLAEQIGDPVQKGWVLNTLARLAGDQGDVREELRLYDQAIPLMQGAGFAYGEAGLVFNRALVSTRLRDFDAALEAFDRAKRLAGGAITAELELAIAGGRANVLEELGRDEEADQALAEAVAGARVALPQRVPGLLSSRGRLHARRKHFDRALPLLEEAAALDGARSQQAFGALGELGVARAQAAHPEAEATLREALKRAEQAGGALPWEVLYQLGRREAELRRPTAIATLERAAKEVERGEVVLGDERARARYFGDKAGIYTELVRLLLAEGRVGEALRYLERAKLAELTALRRQAGREADLGLELEVAESRFAEALQKEQEKPQPDADKIHRLDELLADVRRRRADYIDRLDRRLAEKGAGRDVYAIRPLELEKLQEHLPKGMLLLSPIALDDQLVVFAVTHDTITHFDTKIPGSEIERLIAAVLEEVTPPGGTQRGAVPLQATTRKLDGAAIDRLRAPSAKLYDLILRAPLLRFGAPKLLVISAAGSLRYLPFAALHDGQGWLMERTPFIEVTSLDQQKFATLAKLSTKPSVLALADPDGSLPGARREVGEVKAALRSVRILDGEGATLPALRAAIRAPGYDIVHLATHGRLDGQRPEQSHILLAGQPLYYKDIPTLRFAHTRLVVLSACDTASRGSGVEVTGLAYQFERTNVRAVVATLWPVDDGATAKLMAAFYRQLQKGDPPAQALAAAQRAVAEQPQWRHPYYWAPFILLGAP